MQKNYSCVLDFTHFQIMQKKYSCISDFTHFQIDLQVAIVPGCDFDSIVQHLYILCDIILNLTDDTHFVSF